GLRDAVVLVEAGARAAISFMRPESGKNAVEDAGGRAMARSAMVVLHEVAERLLGDGVARRADVLWCERPRVGNEQPRLRLAPLDVAGPVAAGLLAGRAAVLTSATLTLGGTFDSLARVLGLTLDADRPWRGLDVGSPFDYPRQGILYVGAHLPPPGREGPTEEVLAELVRLVRAAGGATLGLFSSRRAAESAAERLRAEVDTPVLCQGEDQLPTLVRRFAADEATSLMGTLSLWQGVDVPGPTCRLVVIDRIPFPRPDDPVKSARAEVVAAAGGNGFMSVSATHAALLLAQGAGRLVRTTTDRGVVAVLDPRLASARYGSFLLRSLPPLWRTNDPAVAAAALERLAAAARVPVSPAP
ncbi:MAG: ATP-dependent DNA helicase, partial [Georgenia sp.]